MGDMVTNVWVKSNYDWLRIDKALGFRKADNNKNKNKLKHNVRSDLGVPFRLQEESLDVWRDRACQHRLYSFWL